MDTNIIEIRIKFIGGEETQFKLVRDYGQLESTIETLISINAIYRGTTHRVKPLIDYIKIS